MKVGGEQKRGIHSETFARQATGWTTEIVWMYTHTGYKRITHGFMFKVVTHCFRIASSSRASSTNKKFLMRVKKKITLFECQGI